VHVNYGEEGLYLHNLGNEFIVIRQDFNFIILNLKTYEYILSEDEDIENENEDLYIKDLIVYKNFYVLAARANNQLEVWKILK
jgi:hypothetical protein